MKRLVAGSVAFVILVVSAVVVNLVRRPDTVVLGEMTTGGIRWQLLGVPEVRINERDNPKGDCLDVVATSVRSQEPIGSVGACGVDGVRLTSEGFVSTSGRPFIDTSSGGSINVASEADTEEIYDVRLGFATCSHCEVLITMDDGTEVRRSAGSGAYFMVTKRPRNVVSVRVLDSRTGRPVRGAKSSRAG